MNCPHPPVLCSASTSTLNNRVAYQAAMPFISHLGKQFGYSVFGRTIDQKQLHKLANIAVHPNRQATILFSTLSMT